MPNVAAAETTTPSDDVAEWLSLIDAARKDMRDYEQRCDRIRKRYTYENSQTVKRRRFQIIWANQEILRPAVYARRPSPSVTNRWKDGDAVARITCAGASLDGCDENASNVLENLANKFV